MFSRLSPVKFGAAFYLVGFGLDCLGPARLPAPALPSVTANGLASDFPACRAVFCRLFHNSVAALLAYRAPQRPSTMYGVTKPVSSCTNPVTWQFFVRFCWDGLGWVRFGWAPRGAGEPRPGAP